MSDDDITVDASPNPRNTCNKEEVESENTFNKKDGVNIPQSDDQNINFNTTKKTKKHSTASASATIINISKSREIHVGNKITYNFNGNEKHKKTDIPETSAITCLKESKTPITREDLWFVATHMNSEWKDVARALGTGEGQISQFIADNQLYGIKEVIYQVLLDWYQNNPTEANVGKLCTVLWNNDHKDVVKRWSQEK